MVVTTETVDVKADGGTMRMLVTAPRTPAGDETRHPALVMYSDIFQLTGPQRRMSARLAGYGFVVATPEIYRRVLPAGTAIPFDDAGRTRGLEAAKQTKVADFDADRRVALDWLANDPRVDASRLGAMGFCIGGHLAFRAAFEPDVRATVCFYPTGLQDGKLGADADAGSLARVKDIRGELLLVFGTSDPHIPDEARAAIAEALARAGTRVSTSLYPAEHAFMRDEGPRYDPEATDLAWAEAIAFLRRTL
jgi:carboxymethylenebutenolidase